MKRGLSLRIGTRGSKLALAQAAIVVDLISRSRPGTLLEVVPIRTAGDAGGRVVKETDRKLAFTSEIDRQLLEGKVDIAVHSLKDIPSAMDGRLTIAATPPRGDARDVLVTLSGRRLSELHESSVVGTSSIRRKVQLLDLRPGLKVVDVAGNVETRIGRMKERGLEGVVLAAAGLQRLGLASEASQYFSVEEMVPAPCQGVIAVEARQDDHQVMEAVGKIDDPVTHLESACERAFLGRLGGDCNFPAGAYARIGGTELTVVGMIADPEGLSLTRSSLVGPSQGPERLGARLAERLLESGGTAPKERAP